MADAVAQGTEDTSTLDAAAHSFAEYLSGFEEPETTETSETQPTQESPESGSDEAEVVTEATDAEDTAAQTETTDDAPQDPADSLDPNTKVRVKIDGQDVEVTLDEAIKGYSRQADYTRKTQELATQRKTQESEFQAVVGERRQYAEMIGQMQQALQDLTGPEPDWAKVQAEQPNEFPTLYTQWQIRQGELKALAEEHARAGAAVQKDHADQRQRFLDGEQTKLLDALPTWKNAETAKAEKAAIVAYAEKSGFSREELSTVQDHRAVVMLRKAMLYDKAQASKPALTQRIEKVKTATPGPTTTAPKPVSDLTKARQRLAKTGSIQDAAEGFALLLGD